MGVPASTELLEREGAQAEIGRLLESVRAGFGGALFLIGEAGLGKSALLRWARQQAGPDIDVSRACGEAMETVVAFGLLVQALGGVADDDLAWLHDQALEPSAPYYRTLRLLESRRDRPLLLALDDLHFSDEDSLRVVAFLARRLAALPVALIGALRPWPPMAADACRQLVSGGHAGLQTLEPLGRRSIDLLLAERCGAAVSADDASRAFSLSGGNPLLAEQLAVALKRGDGMPPAGGAGGVAERVLLSRFAGMHDDGVRLARAASVLGSSFRAEVAAAVAGLDEGRADRALEALCSSGLVSDDGDLLRFQHPLFAQALYEDQPLALRKRQHARAVRLLSARGLEGQACEHALLAELVGDVDAIELLTQTGSAALRAGAVASAVRNLEGAVRLSGDRPAASLMLTLARALSAAGQVREGEQVCARLLNAGELSPAERIEALRLRGRAQYLSVAPEHGRRSLERATELALEHDPAAAVQPLLDQSLIAWLLEGTTTALPLAERARALADDDAGPELSDLVEATWALLALEAGDPAGTEPALATAGRIRAGADGAVLSPAELAWPYARVYQVSLAARYLERFDEAERTLRVAREAMERAGAADALATLALHLAHTLLRRGRLTEALAEADLAHELAELTPGVAAYTLIARAEALAWLGRFEEAEECCAQAEGPAMVQWFARVWLVHVRGMRRLWIGDPGASDEFLEAERITRGAGVREPCVMLWQAHAVVSHLAAGRRADAARIGAWLEQCARPLSCRWPRIAASIARAQLAESAGDDERADRHYRAALELHEQTELPLQRAETLLWHGGMLRRSGERREARAQLAAALALAERAGALSLARIAHSELRLAGGRRRRDEDRDRLTEAERRVAQLAAHGLRNSEIAGQLYISVNTVQTHLKHVYAKLGVNSRHQLRELDDADGDVQPLDVTRIGDADAPPGAQAIE